MDFLGTLFGWYTAGRDGAMARARPADASPTEDTRNELIAGLLEGRWRDAGPSQAAERVTLAATQASTPQQIRRLLGHPTVVHSVLGLPLDQRAKPLQALLNAAARLPLQQRLDVAWDLQDAIAALPANVRQKEALQRQAILLPADC
jgi:hypothetical protein